MVNDLAVQEFVEAIKETPTDPNTTYSAIVSRIDSDGIVWINLQGSEKETPTASSSSEIKAGDRVTVNWRNNKLYIGGNYSNPSAGVTTVQPSVDYVAELIEKDVTVNSINAATGYIGDLTADHITAGDISASSGYIKDLTSENITAQDIISDHAEIGDLDVNYAKVNAANIDSAAIRNAWVDKIMVQTGLLAYSSQVYTLDAIEVNAANITAGTLDVNRLIVTVGEGSSAQKYLVNIDPTTGTPSYQKLDGNIVEPRTITADKIVAGAITTNEITTNNLQGTSGWINLHDGTFFYGNGTNFATSNNAISWNGSKLQIKADEFLLSTGKTIQDSIESVENWFYSVPPTTSNPPASSWTTTNLKEQHLRDIYFDTTSGKSYRWSKDNNVYSWVEIEDVELAALTKDLHENYPPRSEFTVAPDQIQSTVSAAQTAATDDANTATDNKLKNYSTTTDMNSAIKQKAGEIDLSVDKKISDVISVKEESGNIVSIDDASEYPALDLVANIEPVQSGSGTPSPDNVRPISGHTEVVTQRTGKNLCARYTDRANNNGIEYTVTDEGIRVHGTATASSYSWGGTYSYDEFPIHLKAGTYEFSVTDMVGANQQQAYVTFMGESRSGANLGNVAVLNGKTTSITQTFTEEVGLRYGFYVKSGLSFDKVVKVQIELGTTATAYEPYEGSTYTTDLGRTVYGGSLDLVSGVLTVDRAMVDLGSLNWTTNNADLNIFQCLPSGIATVVEPPYTNRQKGAICSAYPPSETFVINANMTDKSWLRGGNVFYIRDTDYSDVASFKTAMNGVQLVYELAEPQTYQLTAQQVMMLLGSNNVWSDTGDTYLKYVTMNSDMLSLMDKSNADLERAKAEIKITTDGITSEVSKKVGSSEIISKINQSAETVQIDASKVEIDGAAVFNNTDFKNAADAAYDSKGSASAVQTALQSEIDAKKSIHTLTTNNTAGRTYAEILALAAEGAQNTFTVNESTTGIKVDDTVRIKYLANDMGTGGTWVYIIGTVRIQPSTNAVAITAHGLDTTVIDGGHILTGTIDASKVNVSNLTVGAFGSAEQSKVLNSEIEVGGRNLLLSAPTRERTAEFHVYTIPTTVPFTDFKTGDKITIQLWDVVLDSASTGVRVFWGGGSILLVNTTSPDANGYISATYTVTGDESQTDAANQFIRIYNMPSAGHDNKSLTVGKWKLERGTRATDWTPSPEDVDADIAESAKTADTYITAIDEDGIKVHAANNPTSNYAKINADGMEVYSNSDSVASFGADGVRVGKIQDPHIEFGSTSSNFYGNNQALVGSIKSGNETVGEYTESVGIKMGYMQDNTIPITDAQLSYPPTGNLSLKVRVGSFQQTRTLPTTNDYDVTTDGIRVQFIKSTRQLTVTNTGKKGLANLTFVDQGPSAYQIINGEKRRVVTVSGDVYTKRTLTLLFDPKVGTTGHVVPYIAKNNVAASVIITFTAGTAFTKKVTTTSYGYSATLTYDGKRTFTLTPITSGSAVNIDDTQYTAEVFYAYSTVATYDRKFLAPQFLFGSQNEAGDYSYVSEFGEGLTAGAINQTIVGRFNAVGTKAFYVGKGSNSSSRSNAMEVDWSGNMTIAGSLTQSSDRRLKEHISYLDSDADDFIRDLKPAHYTKDNAKHVGFYAQDVEEADKWDCMVGEMNGYKTLGYTELIAPLVAYCQHLEKRIEALERTIK